ncbi:MAG: AsmA family protein [Verrucomicrobia bacterium]|nr:AsmA family protein [Verrucomicrobiota bacterium]
MTTNAPTLTLPKRRRWLKRLAWICVILLVLLVAAYFIATSNAFFQRVILPQAGRSLNSTVTVSEASIHPFSRVILRDLKVQPRGEEPVFEAREVRVRYRLLSILGGALNLDEAVLESPIVRVIQKADGTSNLDPILRSMSEGKPDEAPAPSSAPSKPMQVDLKKLAVNGAVLSFSQTAPNGDTFRAEIPHLNVALTNVKNGQTARFTLEGNLDLRAATRTNVSQLAGTLKGDIRAALAKDLTPDRIEGGAEFAETTATGAFADAKGLTTALTTDLDATQVKQLALQFAKKGAPLGRLSVSGPLDLRKLEGNLTIALTGIGAEVLSLVGGPYGMSFGETKLAAKCDLALRNQAQVVTAVGSMTGASCSVTREQLTTPKVDFQLDYNMKADMPATRATLSRLALNATQNAKPFLLGGLTREMVIDWGKGDQAVEASMLELVVTNLDLVQWQAVTGPEVKGGILNGRLGLNVQNAGKKVAFDLASQIADLSAEFASNRLSGIHATFATRGQVTDFSRVDLADVTMQTTHAGNPLMSLKGSGTLNATNMEANLQTEMTASLAQACALLTPDQPLMASGTATFTGRVAQRNAASSPSAAPALAQDIAGNLHLADLVVRPAPGTPAQKPLEARLSLDASQLNQRLDFRQTQLALTPTPRARNEIALTGHVDMSRSNAITGNLKLASDALDFTDYYAMFESQPAIPGTPPAKTKEPLQDRKPPPPETEAPPYEMPVRDFVTALEVGRLHVREMAISNLQATVRLDGSKVTLHPVQMTLNGAPASSKVDLNMGVPGYQYAVDLQARQVPVAPFVDSFQPERKGQMAGTFNLLAQISGTGVTGPSLQKNLAGQFDFGATNLNLKLIDVKNNVLKSVINVIIGLPDIIRNPGAAVTSLVGKLSGSRDATSSGGWIDDVSKAPIDSIDFRGRAGQGRVEVQHALVQSPGFQVQTKGLVTLAPVLTNSTIEFPVTLALERSLAAKIGQAGASTPTNIAYVNLPDFLTMQGTVGEPKKKLDYPALAKMAVQLGGGIVGGTGQAVIDQATGLVDDVKGIFGRKDSTNAPTTNKPSVKSVLDKVLQLQPPGTKAPSDTNAPAKRKGLFDMLK